MVALIQDRSPAYQMSPVRRDRWGVHSSVLLSGCLRSFRHRNYRLFFGGQSVSLIGMWMQTVGESWLMYRLTGDPAMLGLAACASQVPTFLFSPLGGAVADRFSGRALLLFTESTVMVLTLGLALLAITHRVQPWHVLTLAALLGVVNAFALPARQVFLAETVGRDDLLNAIAMNASMFNGASVIGPALAGIFISAVGEGWCFMLNSLTSVVALLGFWMMSPPGRLSKEREEGRKRPRVFEGFRFARDTPGVLGILRLLGLTCLLGIPHSVLMPLFADRILHTGPKGVGALMGASGCGALLGALTLAARRTEHGLARWIAGGCLSFGVALSAFACSRTFWISILLMVPVGYSFMITATSGNTLIQLMVPDEMRGRVVSIYSMIFMGTAPVGALLAGALAPSLGAPRTVAIGAIGIILGGTAFLLHSGRQCGSAKLPLGG